MFLGYSIVHWLIALIAAIFVFLLLDWLLGLILAALGLPVPHILVTLFCLLVALGVLFGGPRYWGTRSA